MNIYITFDNEQKLKVLKDEGISMSGLVNELLDDYFAKDKSVAILQEEASPTHSSTPPPAFENIDRGDYNELSYTAEEDVA